MRQLANICLALMLLSVSIVPLTACQRAAEPIVPSPETAQARTTLPAPAQTAPATEEPGAQHQEPAVALDGESLVAQRCSVCHSLTRVQQASKSESEWEATVTRMIGNGAKLSPEEKAAVVKYLAQTYRP